MRCCGAAAARCSNASGAARCNAVALASMQAGRVSPARTRTAAEPTMCSIAAAGSTDNDGNGLCLHRACASCGMTDPRAHTQHAPVGPATEAAALPCVACCVMRCCGADHVLDRRRWEHRQRREWPVCASSLRGCGMADPRAHTAHASRSCYRSGCRVCHAGAAAAARERTVQPDAMQWLWVLMRAGRVSPAPTRTAAESTRCSIATAVSTDIDANGLCVHRACCAAAEWQWPTHGHTQHTPVGPATEAAALPCVTCGAAVRQLLAVRR